MGTWDEWSQWCDRLRRRTYGPVPVFVLGKGQARRIGTALTQVRKEAFGLGKLNKEQDSMLLGEGFEPAGDGLWRRDGTYFGREAAMQKAHSGQLQRGDYALYDLANRGEPRAEEDEAV